MHGKKVILIACVTPLGVYGSDENGKPGIPWHSRLDMARFRKYTMGHTLVIGFKTFESLHGRKLLGRDIIVVTSRPVKCGHDEGVVFCSSLDEAIKKSKTTKVFVGGGAKLWMQALAFADELIITIINVPISETNMTVSCKELVDPTNKYPNFRLIAERVATEVSDEGYSFGLKFRRYIRIKSPKRSWWSSLIRKIVVRKK